MRAIRVTVVILIWVKAHCVEHESVPRTHPASLCCISKQNGYVWDPDDYPFVGAIDEWATRTTATQFQVVPSC